ncbi:MAG: hypothetical protein ABJA20_09570 [Novosphingobium sp.]
MSLNLTLSTTPVILNSFQDPSCQHAPKLSVARLQACRNRSAFTAGTERAAKWMLKQVQHDDVVWEAAE